MENNETIIQENRVSLDDVEKMVDQKIVQLASKLMENQKQYMKHSDSIENIAGAFSKFQGEVTNPFNIKTNEFFKSKYATLDEVLNTVRPILAKHGLSVLQIPIMENGMVGVITRLMHTSGEFFETQPFLLRVDKNTPQGAGSAMTYARRYTLSTILGVASEDDDDGNSAEPGGRPSGRNVKNPKLEDVKNALKGVNAESKVKLAEFIKENNVDVKNLDKCTDSQLDKMLNILR